MFSSFYDSVGSSVWYVGDLQAEARCFICVCICVCVHTLTLHTHTSECKAVDLNTIDLKDAFPEQGSGWR